jgi:hypothetical protein
MNPCERWLNFITLFQVNYFIKSQSDLEDKEEDFTSYKSVGLGEIN